MGYSEEITESNVDERIDGEFMNRLHASDVSFELIELLEGQLSDSDYGGSEELIELIEAELVQDAN